MSKDTIYREDAIKAFDDAFSSIPMKQTKGILKEILKVRRVIRELPSVDRPRGEWIYVTVEEWLRTGRDYGHHCSECDEINKSGRSNFCPNCGAPMKGADDE